MSLVDEFMGNIAVGTTVLFGLLVGVVGIHSCLEKSEEPKKPAYVQVEEGIYAKAVQEANANRLIVTDNPLSDSNRYSISASDFNKDGRFDEVYLVGVPRGHALERYAALDLLEKTYNEVRGK